MKRLFAALLMALALTATAVPAAQASHSRECTEVWIHFRPAYCTDQHDGLTWIWVCPDGWWNRCYLVFGPIQ
jgi:Spy/CpxP family protein refolding chaperone